MLGQPGPIAAVSQQRQKGGLAGRCCAAQAAGQSTSLSSALPPFLMDIALSALPS